MTPEDTKPEEGKFVPLPGGQTSRRGPTEAKEAEGPLESVNLVDHLSADELRRIATVCLRDFEADVDSRSARMKKLREFNEAYALVAKPKTKPFSGAANISAPLLTAPVLQISSRLYDMVWPLSGQVVHSLSTTVADLQTANITEKFANSYLRYKMSEMSQGMDDTCTQLCLFGSTFRRTYWDAASHRVRSDWIPIEDFVVAQSVRSQDPSMGDVERYTMVQHWTIYDLEDLRDKGVIVYDDEKIKAGQEAEKKSDTMFSDSVKKIDGQDVAEDTTPEDKPRQVLEMHRRWRLPKSGDHPAFDGKAHPVMITIDEQSEQVLRIALREEDDPDDARRFQRDLQRHEEWKAASSSFPAMAEQFTQMVEIAAMNGQPIPPEEIEANRPQPPGDPVPEPSPVRKREICFFTHYRCFDSEGFYGLGYGDMLFGLSKGTNTIINQHIDGVTLRNSKPGFISRQAKMQRGQVNVQPGEFIEVDMPSSQIKDAIVFVEPPMNDPGTVPLINLFQAMADRISGSGDTMSGQIPGSNQTAEGMKLLVEQMNLPVTVLSRRVSSAFAHELEKIWRCWGVFLEDEELADIVNDNGDPEQLMIRRDMFTPTARVIPASDPRLKSQRVNEANALIQAIGHPFIVGSPANPPHPNAPKIMETVLSQQLATLGADRLLPLLQMPPPPPPPPPPEPKPPFAEHAQWLRGQDTPPHPMDDDPSHIQEHMAFLQSQEGAMLPPQGQEMAMNHIRHHVAAQIEKANGGMTNGQPPGPPGPGPGQPPGPPPPPMGGPPGGGPPGMAPGAPNGPVPPAVAA